MRRKFIAATAIGLTLAAAALAEPVREAVKVFTAADVFRLESASGPEISPDGKLVAYVRVTADVMTDRFRRSIWIVDENGASHWPLAQGKGSYTSPVWSPDGRSIAYAATEDGASEIRLFDLASRRSATLSRLPSGAQNLSWSADGKTLAFESFVQESGLQPAALPPKPEGATWADPVKVYDTINYRADGSGLVDAGYTQIFVLPIDGGTPRQLTFQPRHHDGRLSWTFDGKTLLFSANAEADWEHNPNNSDLYSLDVVKGDIKRLTTRKGPDDSPALSPNGKLIAYTGFDDKELSYQVSALYVANADGSNPRAVTATLDRDVSDPQWVGDGEIWFSYEDGGGTKLAHVPAGGGKVVVVADTLTGATVDRPYTGGAFSVNKAGRYAVTTGDSVTPAEVAISSGGKPKVLTNLNSDVFAGKSIGAAEHISVPSSYDKRPVDAWIIRPPNFDAAKKYPLLLEIHGGPHSAYGPAFAAEAQMYAAAGYVVVYSNPRGSTSYGEEFADLIHHNYPSQDYDDLMSVVDATIAKGAIDTNRLFVTGGSGGGVLTAWIVGSTNRFAAAMVQKPVINWTSEVLSADGGVGMSRYWFGELPWEPGAQARYWARSPLSKVGNVKTSTAVMVGEEDNRTPHSEAEQYYQALQLRKAPTELILVPGSSHDIAGRPTGLIAKVTNTLAWFARYGGPPVPDPSTGKADTKADKPGVAAGAQ